MEGDLTFVVRDHGGVNLEVEVGVEGKFAFFGGVATSERMQEVLFD